MRESEKRITVRNRTSKASKSNRDRDVDAYIKAAPKEARLMLVQLREIIRTTAPRAIEGISYRIPYYDYNGPLVWFAAFKNHIGLYVRPPVIDEHKQELEGYETTKSAVRFPIGKPLPVTLIRRLVKARIAKNENAGR
jgi:uncharacterized protein YdhG (YjbR/CyaY superfamily)